MSKRNKNHWKRRLCQPALAPYEPELDNGHDDPVLRFSLEAWSKLLWFCHAGQTEIGGFGISSPEDPLKIQRFETIRQLVSSVTVSFDDDAVAEFFEEQVDAGLRPEQFARIWLHTHPGDSPYPSLTDEQTFARVFGNCNWAVMFILSRTGRTYARLRFNVGPAGEVRLPVEVDMSCPYAASDQETWEMEYLANVFREMAVSTVVVSKPDQSTALARKQPQATQPSLFDSNPTLSPDTARLLEQFERLSIHERQRFLDELGQHPDLWAEEGGYLYEWGY